MHVSTDELAVEKLAQAQEIAELVVCVMPHRLHQQGNGLKVAICQADACLCSLQYRKQHKHRRSLTWLSVYCGTGCNSKEKMKVFWFRKLVHASAAEFAVLAGHRQ